METEEKIGQRFAELFSDSRIAYEISLLDEIRSSQDGCKFSA
jgi:hypothetical protein